MKNQKINEFTNFHDEQLERLIAEKDQEFNNLSRRHGKMLAERKLPNATKEKLISCIGEIKARYEGLGVLICKKLQPAVHFPEVNTDTMNAEAEKREAMEEIKKIDKQIENFKYEMEKLNVEGIYQNAKEIRIKTALFFMAEAFFFALAFQILGENTLFSFLIAVPLTLAVSEYAHLVASQYRKYQNVIKRRIFLFLAIMLALTVFFGLSYFRSIALGRDGYSLETLCFVVINLFIFLVSCFLHFKYSLTKEEKIKYHTHKKLKNDVMLKEAEKNQINKQITELDAKVNEKALLTLKLHHYTMNTIEEIRKRYCEAVEIFKSANISYREDRIVPECFSEPTPELDINYDFNLYKFNDKEE